MRAGSRLHLALLAGVCWSVTAQAPPTRHAFDIPAGMAGAALQAFAQQSHRQLLFPYDAVNGRRVPRIHGLLEDQAVLATLAQAGGLIVLEQTASTIILGRAPLSSPQPKGQRRRTSLFGARSIRIAPPQVVGPKPDDLAIHDIIVTATKRDQLEASVPIALTVLDGRDLRTLGIQSATDLQNIVPGVEIDAVQHGISINIRGVTTTDITSKGEQGIAFSVDGTFIGRPIEQALSFFDLARIEVLRGPQGTLYGKSSTGGAVNVVTQAPVDRWEAYATVETGNYDARRAEGAVNIPVTDWLAVRAAGALDAHAGYLLPSDGSRAKSSANDQTMRLSARARITPTITARVTLTGGHVGGTGTGYADLGNLIDGTSSSAQRTIYPNPFPSGLDHHFLNVDGEVDADLGWGRLSYVGAHLHFHGDEWSAINNDPHDPNPPVGPFDLAVQTHGHFLTGIDTDAQELRLSNPQPARLDYVIGVNAYHEHIAENDHNLNAPQGDPDPADSVNMNDIIGTTIHNSYGVFGQATLHVDHRLGVVGGVRYSHDSVRRQAIAAFGLDNAAGQPCYGSADCIGNAAPGSEQAGKLTYRIGANFQLTPADLFYAVIATGYKAGGFNDATSAKGSPTRYAPEQLTAYQLGYKGRPSETLRLEAEAFYYDYARTQINGVIFVNGGSILNTRVVPTRIYGIESQLTWSLSPHTALGLSAAYEHSLYVHFLAGLFQNIDWSNLSLDRTPPFVGMLTLNQSWDLPEGWALRLRLFSKLSMHYYVSDFTSGFRYRQPGFTRSDASLTLAAPGDRWSLQLFVQNIENQVQAVSPPQNYDPAYLNAAYLNVSDPRLYGLRVNVRWP